MKNVVAFAVVAAVLGMANTAGAGTILFDQNLTSNVIYGSENANGDFTIDRDNGIELGLRAKIPYVGSINPDANSNIYHVASGLTWNFDWSINSDYTNPVSSNLNAFRFEIGVDSNPDVATSVGDFTYLNPFALGFYTWDNSFGNNNTNQGAGVETTRLAFIFNSLFTNLVNGRNLAQNSWQPGWVNNDFDFNILNGTYDIILNAFDKGNNALLASTNIQVIVGEGGTPVPGGPFDPGPAVVPVPAAAPLGLLGMGLIAFLRRRKKNSVE